MAAKLKIDVHLSNGVRILPTENAINEYLALFGGIQTGSEMDVGDVHLHFEVPYAKGRNYKDMIFSYVGTFGKKVIKSIDVTPADG
jgi:hypothetical protein